MATTTQKDKDDWTIRRGTADLLHPYPPRRAEFSPTRTSDFRAFQAKTGTIQPKLPPDLRNTASWEHSHKTTGRLDHSKGPNTADLLHPYQGSSSELTTFEPKTNKFTKEQPQRLVQSKEIYTYYILTLYL